jgi:ABC-2 type transport system ATP-binding protein
MSIVIENLSKVYGAQKAVHNISFNVQQGEIVGFLGPNGAGKSTTMKILTGYLTATSGKAIIGGIDVQQNPIAVKQKVGYLPESNALYYDMYVKEYLAFIAGVHNIQHPASSIQKVIELTGLQIEQHKKIGQLSKGYKQRVGLAAALIHNPEVLILDEPTSGLDPNQIVEIRNVIKEQGKNKTVLFSSHILQEVEAICDRIIIIDKGKIVTDKKLNKLVAEETEQVIEVEFDKKVSESDFIALPNLKSAKNIHNLVWELTFSTATDMRPTLFDFAQANNLRTLQIVLKSKNLEQIFREKTGKR